MSFNLNDLKEACLQTIVDKKSYCFQNVLIDDTDLKYKHIVIVRYSTNYVGTKDDKIIMAVLSFSEVEFNKLNCLLNSNDNEEGNIKNLLLNSIILFEFNFNEEITFLKIKDINIMNDCIFNIDKKNEYHLHVVFDYFGDIEMKDVSVSFILGNWND